MSNTAIITTAKKELGIYLHWNGGQSSVVNFLQYCKASGFRSPETDNYGWARLSQVVANFFGGSGLSVGIDLYEHLDTEGSENGVFIVKDWAVTTIEPAGTWRLRDTADSVTWRMFIAIDESQPRDQQLGNKACAEYFLANGFEVPLEIEIEMREAK